MMQQLASSKSQVAAFAALSEPASQADSGAASGFEHIMQQQRPAESAANKPRARQDAETRTQTVPNEKTPAAHKSVASNSADPNTQRSHAAEHNSRKSTESREQTENNNPLTAQKSQQTTQSETKTNTIKAGQSAPQDTTELQTASAQQDGETAVDSEEWIALIAQLQSLSEDAASDQAPRCDNLENIQQWLESQDDKVLALSALLAQQPDLAALVANVETVPGDDFALLKLTLQQLTQQGEEPVPLQSDVDSRLLKSLPQSEKQQSAETLMTDIARLMAQNALSEDELAALKASLAAMKTSAEPVEPWVTELLQSKLAELAAAERSQKPAKLALPELTVGQQAVEGKQAVNLATDGKTRDELTQAVQDLLDGLNAASTLPSGNKSQTNGNNSVSAVTLSVVDADNGVAANPKPILSEAELKALAELPESQLDDALSVIAQKLVLAMADENKSDNKLKSAALISLNGQSQADSNQQTADAILASLKSGFAEYKKQLAAGHEPGLDLQALVANALVSTANSADEAKLSASMEKVIQQSLRDLNQSLQATEQAAEIAEHRQSLQTLGTDSVSAALEQHKAALNSQIDSKLDKAINLQKPEAHQQLAEKVRWMVNTNNLIADIRLDPAELGSMQVKVSMNADSASVSFVVQSHHARDALETATPKLREMLAEKGIELGQSSVRQENQARQDGQGEGAKQNGLGSSAMASAQQIEDEQNQLTAAPQRVTKGEIDYFV